MQRIRRSRWIVVGLVACMISLGAWMFFQREELFGPFTEEGRTKTYFRLLDEAESCKEQGNVDRAISLYGRAVRIAPDYLQPPALYSRAGLLVSRDRPREAIADLDRALALKTSRPDGFDSRVLALRARAHSAVKDWRRALADADEAIRLHPSAENFQDKCMILYDAGRREEALRVANEALAGMPDNVMLLHTRAMLNWFGRDYATAKASLEEAVRHARELELNDWTRAWTLSNLAAYLSTCVEDAERDGKRAVELAAEACRLSNWKDPEFLESLACAHAETGNFEAAIQWQQRAVNTSNESERAERANILAQFRTKRPFRQEHRNAKR
jgi:tetratricopeptide (TPR) repeat protein